MKHLQHMLFIKALDGGVGGGCEGIEGSSAVSKYLGLYQGLVGGKTTL